MADEEFIDLEEYLGLLSTLKANAMVIIRTAAESYPQQAVAFLKERLPALVQRFGSNTDQVKTHPPIHPPTPSKPWSS